MVKFDSNDPRSWFPLVPGGDNPGDRDVPLVVYAPGTVQAGRSSHPVETTQVAPTILKLLGLNPRDLRAVRIEHTRVLPGVHR